MPHGATEPRPSSSCPTVWPPGASSPTRSPSPCTPFTPSGLTHGTLGRAPTDRRCSRGAQQRVGSSLPLAALDAEAQACAIKTRGKETARRTAHILRAARGLSPSFWGSGCGRLSLSGPLDPVPHAPGDAEQTRTPRGLAWRPGENRRGSGRPTCLFSGKQTPVPGVGLEPTRATRPNGFSYHSNFHWWGVVWTFSSPYPAGRRCCPSSLCTFPESGLAQDYQSKGFPDFEQIYVRRFRPSTHLSKSVASTNSATPAIWSF